MLPLIVIVIFMLQNSCFSSGIKACDVVVVVVKVVTFLSLSKSTLMCKEKKCLWKK